MGFLLGLSLLFLEWQWAPRVTMQTVMGMDFLLFFSVRTPSSSFLYQLNNQVKKLTFFFQFHHFKTVYHKLECFCDHLMSDCIFSEILVYLWRRRKVWRRIRGEQQTAKICTACQSLEKKETGEGKKMSRRRLQMRLVSIRGSMGMQGKMLCASMIRVHGQT